MVGTMPPEVDETLVLQNAQVALGEFALREVVFQVLPSFSEL
jgi:hypothetical protein